MTSVFEGQPFKTRPFLSKTRVMKGFHPITPLNPPENQVSQTLLEGLQIITLKGSKVNKNMRENVMANLLGCPRKLVNGL